jgi:hypothetical protein
MVHVGEASRARDVQSVTHKTRPALIDSATKRVLDIRQVFEDMFR